MAVHHLSSWGALSFLEDLSLMSFLGGCLSSVIRALLFRDAWSWLKCAGLRHGRPRAVFAMQRLVWSTG
jgi:hypothetical protein